MKNRRKVPHVVERSIPVKKKRDSNLELYRIIVMLLIVCHHYVMHSGILDVCKDNYMSENSIFFYLFGMWGKIGINCFVMITGYYMCRSNITLKKFIKLLFEIELYRIVIYIIFMSVGKDNFSLTNLVYTIIPFRNIDYLFVPAFMYFFLLIPFINILINNINKKQHLYLLCLLLILYTVLSSTPGCSVSFNYVSWFVVLYLTAAFFRIYPPSFSKLKYLNTQFKFFLIMTILCVIVSIASVLLILYFNDQNNNVKEPYRYVSDCNVIMAFLTSVCSFNMMKAIKIPYSKIVNIIGGSTFGVLLIHDGNSYMRHWLWKDVINVHEIYDSSHYVIYSMLAVLLVFSACIIIDRIRIMTIERPFLYYIDKLTAKKSSCVV